MKMIFNGSLERVRIDYTVKKIVELVCHPEHGRRPIYQCDGKYIRVVKKFR